MRKSFTLIELLVVVAIICVILAILIACLHKPVKKAIDASSGVTARHLIDNTVIRDLSELRKYEKRLKRLRETQEKLNKQK